MSLTGIAGIGISVRRFGLTLVRNKSEYSIFNKEYPTDEGKAEYKRQSAI